jgi:hypothetical protein
MTVIAQYPQTFFPVLMALVQKADADKFYEQHRRQERRQNDTGGVNRK